MKLYSHIIIDRTVIEPHEFARLVGHWEKEKKIASPVNENKTFSSPKAALPLRISFVFRFLNYRS